MTDELITDPNDEKAICFDCHMLLIQQQSDTYELVSAYLSRYEERGNHG